MGDRPPLRVCLLGAGLTGAQIGCEYALHGHDVVLVARDPAAARARAETGLRTLAVHGLADDRRLAAAAARLSASADAVGAATGCDLIVESLPEDLALKGEVLGAAAASAPDALVATNTSSLRVTEIGRASGTGPRIVGTHYWNPPLLMPLVEVVAGDETAPARVDEALALVASLGKTPIHVRQDVPGFVWNRLQVAVLREAAALVADGVVEAAEVDRIARDGLARRWRQVGPFAAAALGGVATWTAVGRQVAPSLSRADALPDLAPLVAGVAVSPDAVARRDRGLAADLRADRA